MKKILLLKSAALTLSCMLCFLTACGSDADSDADADLETRESMIKEVSNLPDATIIIPAPLVGDELADIDIDTDTDTAAVSDSDAGTDLEEDGNNVTYELDGETRTQILNDLASEIEESIGTILADKYYYPNVSDIVVNEDCTEFTIYLTTDMPNVYESMLMLSFYTVGDRYQIYNGVPMEEAKTTVVYINTSTGAELARTDSTSSE